MSYMMHLDSKKQLRKYPQDRSAFFRTNSILSDTYRIYVAVTIDIFVFFLLR